MHKTPRNVSETLRQCQQKFNHFNECGMLSFARYLDSERIGVSKDGIAFLFGALRIAELKLSPFEREDEEAGALLSEEIWNQFKLDIDLVKLIEKLEANIVYRPFKFVKQYLLEIEQHDKKRLWDFLIEYYYKCVRNNFAQDSDWYPLSLFSDITTNVEGYYLSSRHVSELDIFQVDYELYARYARSYFYSFTSFNDVDELNELDDFKEFCRYLEYGENSMPIIAYDTHGISVYLRGRRLELSIGEESVGDKEIERRLRAYIHTFASLLEQYVFHDIVLFGHCPKELLYDVLKDNLLYTWSAFRTPVYRTFRSHINLENFRDYWSVHGVSRKIEIL